MEDVNLTMKVTYHFTSAWQTAVCQPCLHVWPTGDSTAKDTIPDDLQTITGNTNQSNMIHIESHA